MPIHYEHDGEGPEVLLIQGTGIAGCGWSPQVEGLRDAFHLAWFDNPGVGRSDGPAGGIERMVAAAVEVLDALGWQRAHVAGHSLGGIIAQRLALDHPSRVRSLALLNTLARGKSAFSFSPASLWLQTRMLVGPRDARRRAFYEFVSTSPPTEERMGRLEAVFGRALCDLPPATRAQLGVLMKADHRAALAGLEVPSMVVGCMEDKPAPVSESHLLADILGCPLHLFEGGHALLVERPELFNDLLRAHWSKARDDRPEEG